MIRWQEIYRTTIKDQCYLRVLVPRKVKNKGTKKEKEKNVDAL
jgi:hypothetical protein